LGRTQRVSKIIYLRPGRSRSRRRNKKRFAGLEYTVRSRKPKTNQPPPMSTDAEAWRAQVGSAWDPVACWRSTRPCLRDEPCQRRACRDCTPIGDVEWNPSALDGACNRSAGSSRVGMEPRTPGGQALQPHKPCQPSAMDDVPATPLHERVEPMPRIIRERVEELLAETCRMIACANWTRSGDVAASRGACRGAACRAVASRRSRRVAADWRRVAASEVSDLGLLSRRFYSFSFLRRVSP